MHVASHVAMHAVAKVELGSTFAMSRCDSLRQLVTGVSPVAKLVATHVAAIFHRINRALARRRCTYNINIMSCNQGVVQMYDSQLATISSI